MFVLRSTEVFSHDQDETSQTASTANTNDRKKNTPGEGVAKGVKIGIQAVLGIGVFALVIGYGVSNVCAGWIKIYPQGFTTIQDGLTHLAHVPFLKIVGEILAISAAADLAHMLFTVGPDESCRASHSWHRSRCSCICISI